MNHDMLVGVIFGVIATRSYLWVKARLAQPYRWKCPHCDFKLAMRNRSDIFDEMKLDHIHTFHPFVDTI